MYEASFNGRVFRIVPDNPDVGVYLYVFEGDKCVRDELQDTVEVCFDRALEEFGVPFEAWTKKLSLP